MGSTATLRDIDQNSDVRSNLRVCVRVRPLTEKQIAKGNKSCIMYEHEQKRVLLKGRKTYSVKPTEGEKAIAFSIPFFYEQKQASSKIYEEQAADIVDQFVKGYNGTIMTYGQTGSGKTHTIFGGMTSEGETDPGIISRICVQIFIELQRRFSTEKATLFVSVLEIHNEQLIDLSNTTRNNSLTLVKARNSENNEELITKVLGLEEYEMHSVEELVAFIQQCSNRRMTSETQLNDKSSRSHVLFNFILRRRLCGDINKTSTNEAGGVSNDAINTWSVSKLCVVDLAGSERNKRSGVVGEHLREARHINSGLLALGNVIHALTDTKRNTNNDKQLRHISYRDSKLTRLLQESLGGNSLTLFIACVSACELDVDETKNTLKYASRAKRVENVITRNFLTNDFEKGNAGRQMTVLQASKTVELEMLRTSLREKRLSVGSRRQRALEYDRIRRSLATPKTSLKRRPQTPNQTLCQTAFTRDNSESCENTTPNEVVAHRIRNNSQSVSGDYKSFIHLPNEAELGDSTKLPVPPPVTDTRIERFSTSSVDSEIFKRHSDILSKGSLRTSSNDWPALVPVDAQGWVLSEEQDSNDSKRKVKVSYLSNVTECINDRSKLLNTSCVPLTIDIHIR